MKLPGRHGTVAKADVLPQLFDAAIRIQSLFPYGPHLSPEQNRALASLRAAIEKAENVRSRAKRI